MKVIIIVAVILAFTDAQIPSKSCPEVSVVQNFSIAEYAGVWYEQQKYPFIIEVLGRCNTAEYKVNPDDGTLMVTNRQVGIQTGIPISVDGTVHVNSTSGEGKLIVNLFSVGKDVPYWILDTDYKTYTVVWSCRKIPIIGETYSTHFWTKQQILLFIQVYFLFLLNSIRRCYDALSIVYHQMQGWIGNEVDSLEYGWEKDFFGNVAPETS